MLRHHLLTFYRSISRHRVYAALNVIGLAVGLAVFLALTIAARFEFSYDRWLPNAERTFRVSGVYSMPGRPREVGAVIPGPALAALRADFGQIEAGVRLRSLQLPVQVGERGDYEDLVFSDPSFFDVFRLPVAAGDPGKALADTASLAISERMAEKYFGGTSAALGRTLTVGADGQPRAYTVAAVLRDLPENTHLKVDFLARLDRSVLPNALDELEMWNATNIATYIRLPSAEAAQALQAALPGFMQRRADADVSKWLGLKLEALPDLHFNTSTVLAFKPGVDRRFVVMLQIIGALTLLLGVINYVNLSTARAMLRAQEVALRKTFGATRGALIAQFLAEAVAVSLLAGLLALGLVELMLPALNAAVGAHLKLAYLGADGSLGTVIGLTVLVGLAAGAYPALVISRFNPGQVFSGGRGPGGGRRAAALREVLVVAQFAISTALLVGMAVVFAQADFVRRSDVGFRREGLIVVSQAGEPQAWSRRASLQEAFRQIPGVIAVSLSSRYPGEGSTGMSQTFVRAGMRSEPPTVAWEYIGDDWARTYGAHLLAGRELGPAHPADDMAGRQGAELSGLNVVINATAAEALDFARPQDAVGQVIRSRRGTAFNIVGVVQDLRLGPPRDKVPPILYARNMAASAQARGRPAIVVRFAGDPRPVMERMRATWRQVVPGVPMAASTAKTALDAFYRPDAQRGGLLVLAAVVATLIGCLGLYGLASFASQRRTREIGIRKVLGASGVDVAKLLMGQFLRPVLLANLLAWPAAFLGARNWLSGFDQRVPIHLGYFVAAALLALAVAVSTTLAQALRAARAAPAEALRHE